MVAQPDGKVRGTFLAGALIHGRTADGKPLRALRALHTFPDQCSPAVPKRGGNRAFEIFCNRLWLVPLSPCRILTPAREREKTMNHPAMILFAVLAAVAVVSVSAFPARTAPKTVIAWNMNQPQSIQSAGVHDMVGASFHAIHASF